MLTLSAQFRKWTLPSLNLDNPLLLIGVSVQNQYRMANSIDSDEKAHFVSSGSILFAKVSVLVCRDERVHTIKYWDTHACTV